MGGRCSICLRRRPSSTTKVEVLQGEDLEGTCSETESDPDDYDVTLGYGKSAEKFAVNSDGHMQPSFQRSPTSREDFDEFRVLRVNNLTGRVTLFVAGGKHTKPVQYSTERLCPRAHEQPLEVAHCPFCVGNEGSTPPHVLWYDMQGNERISSQPAAGWLMRAIPNIFPMLICPAEFYGEEYQQALEHMPHAAVASGRHANEKVSFDVAGPSCKQVDAQGVSEVFIESPVHNALWALQEPWKISVLMQALSKRGRELGEQSWAKQLLYFKQYGPLSGGSLVHPHTQLISLPVIPPQHVQRIEYSMKTYSLHNRCATCISIEPFLNSKDPELMQNSRFVHATDHFVVSVPYASASMYTMMVVPRRHSSDFTDITSEEVADMGRLVSLLMQALYVGLDDPSFNVFIWSAPCVKGTIQLNIGELSNETKKRSLHWFMEIRPRFPADVGGFEIASGVRVVTGLPEDHAAQLRKWVAARLADGAQPIKPAPAQPADLTPQSPSSPTLRRATLDRRRSRTLTSRSASKMTESDRERLHSKHHDSERLHSRSDPLHSSSRYHSKKSPEQPTADPPLRRETSQGGFSEQSIS
eukprot:TRINITY_DN11491_c0_g5_i1.p1 TRINITY_DN11491_c0_g5~~TRINITY_DN11491_c0_g5_i1.p1  ORF type:complete len:584 (+),score=119.78 TRINITY_DN11491_c0_g5_i1:174-1925(+)